MLLGNVFLYSLEGQKMRSRAFGCPKCHAVVLFYAVGVEDEVVYFLGECTGCHCEMSVPLEKLTDFEPVIGFNTGEL